MFTLDELRELRELPMFALGELRDPYELRMFSRVSYQFAGYQRVIMFTLVEPSGVSHTHMFDYK